MSLVSFHVLSCPRCQMDVVFDSYNTGTEPSRSKVSSNVAVVFTGGQESADTYMERLAVDLELAGTALKLLTPVSD